MIQYIRQHLGIRLLLSYLAIVLIGGVVLLVISQSILPASFNQHMARFGMMSSGQQTGQGAGMGMGSGAGRGAGVGGPGVMAQLFADYRAGFNEALLYASLAAAAAAIILSIVLSRSVIAPIRAMERASQRIADGHYDERVPVRGSDELAQFTERFNGMAKKLEQSESMRRQLIGDVSHELRTPLTTIKGSMEGLVDGILPATRETYELVHGEAERLSRLVDDLQELSRVEAGAYNLECHPVQVAELIDSVVKHLRPVADAKHIVLSVDARPGLPMVQADADRLMQVLTNLIGNAIQYTPEGGRVTILAGSSAHELRVSVVDSGNGIPAEHLPHVFDRFYRVDRSRSRQSGGGSGIGLTIARALVEAHGGRIWAESAGEGKGSTFAFTLPVGS